MTLFKGILSNDKQKDEIGLAFVQRELMIKNLYQDYSLHGYAVTRSLPPMSSVRESYFYTVRTAVSNRNIDCADERVSSSVFQVRAIHGVLANRAR